MDTLKHISQEALTDVEIYFFSGLGADSSVFGRLEIEHPNQRHIDWIETTLGETIEEYAFKLLPQIDRSKRVVFLGVSFGGMVAIEVAKLIDVEKVILVSSVKHSDELPFYFRAAGRMRLHQLIPASLFKMNNPLTHFAFSVVGREEKKLLKNILKQTDDTFLKWAIGRITIWRNDQVPPNVVHIHGTSDKIMPIRFVGDCMRIEGGGHLMIYQKADRISHIVNTIMTEEVLLLDVEK